MTPPCLVGPGSASSAWGSESLLSIMGMVGPFLGSQGLLACPSHYSVQCAGWEGSIPTCRICTTTVSHLNSGFPGR